MRRLNIQPKLLRMEEASAALGLSHWTLRLWAKQGRLRTVKLSNLRLVPADELERIIRQGIGRHRERKIGATANGHQQ